MTGGRDPIGMTGVRFTEHRLEVQEGVRLRLFKWIPEDCGDGDPIFFVAGWISLVTGWRPLLEVLVRKHPVYYLETREKASAEIPQSMMQSENFAIDRLADDLREVGDQLGLNGGRSVLFGSSMGSNAILEALKDDRFRGKAAFLVGPNVEFYFPAWGRVAVRVVPAWLIERLKGFVIWYLRNFRVNERSDPDQMARYVRTVRAADSWRLKLSARAVLDYTLTPGLETISTPVAVAYADNDTLHGEDTVRAIVDSMPCGTAVRCPSNTYMHTAAVAADLEDYLAGLSGGSE